ncbi:DUF1700 domain-containing protein [Paenibacillus caui]|uniref:DUF1700 domain-containing protein n=1 Tax=Paenibacillus caui TaxID=2873927 RepID=UPI001CA84F3D|nr:DUF1700 domain-containing protein [Paenibacillus caui]
MTKNEFLSVMESHLTALPPEERDELMDDYKAHFAFGLQSGKTEEEIVTELGDPAELAKEVLGDRAEPKNEQPLYWFYGQEQKQAQGYAGQTGQGPETPLRRRIAWVSAALHTGLFFLNLVMIPLLIAFWSAGVGIAAGAASGILSPVLLLLDYLKDPVFYPAKAFASVALVGIGILLLLSSRYIFKGLLKLTLNYRGWNVRLMKGNVNRD